MGNPAISILMPARNCEQTIEVSIRSAQTQTFESWELIVVDDCSTDRTAQIVGAMASTDPRIKLIRSSKRRGPGESRLAAYRESSGDILAMLDSDDLWLPDKLDEAFRLVGSGRHDFIHTGHRALVGRILSIGIASYTVSEPHEIDSYNPITNSSVVFCRSLMPSEVTFKYGRGHDWQLWRILVAEGAELKYVPSYSCIYRMSSRSLSGNKLAMARSQLLELKSLNNNGWDVGRKFFSYSLRGVILNLRRLVPSPRATAGLRAHIFDEERRNIRPS